jgi:hypothetical protein
MLLRTSTLSGIKPDGMLGQRSLTPLPPGRLILTEVAGDRSIRRLLIRILRGASDADIPFAGICQLLRRLGFDERIRGSHHILTKEGVEEILNL